MSSSSSFDKSIFLYKKTLGVPYSLIDSSDITSETAGVTFSKVFNSQINALPIPPTAPLSTDLTITSYIDINYNITSSATNAYGTIYTSKTYPWIQYISQLKFQSSLKQSAGYSYGPSNFLVNCIPSNYDPLGTYKITVTPSSGQYDGVNTVPSSDYIIEKDAGYIYFIFKNWETKTSNAFPVISFYRYNGTIGIPTNLGTFAGAYNQATGAIAYGNYAGYTGQGANSVSIGNYAGQYGQGTGSIAIGYLAGPTGMQRNSIALNASELPLFATGPSGGFYVAPVGSYSGSIGPFTLLAYGADKQIVTVTNATGISLSYLSINNTLSAQGLSGGSGTFSTLNVTGMNVGSLTGSTGTFNYLSINNTLSAQGLSGGSGTFSTLNVTGMNVGSLTGSTGTFNYLSINNTNISLGQNAGQTGAVNIGYKAGQYGQGTGSIAIGYLAGPTGMQRNSIALNASELPLFATGPSGGFYVAPVGSYSGSTGPFTLLAYGADKQIVSVTGTVLTNMGIGGGGGGGSSLTNVGIGTLTPNTRLTVQSPSISTITGSSAYAGIHIQPNDNANSADQYTGITWSATNSGTYNTHAGIMVQGSGSYGSKMYFLTTNSWTEGSKIRMMLDHSGNLGIGTTSPSYTLDVSGTARISGDTTLSSTLNAGDTTLTTLTVGGETQLTNTLNVIGTTTLSTLKLPNNSTIYARNSSGSDDVFLHPRYSDNVTYLNFGSGGFNIRNNAATNVMFMTNGGLVGIGTTSPSYKLDVSGTLNVTGATTLTSTLNVTGITTLNAGVGSSGTYDPTTNILGYTAFDGSNIVNIQCQASQYGRNILYMSGRYEGVNDGWAFTTPRNGICFRTQSSLNSAYTNRYTIQNFNTQLGIMSNGKGGAPITYWSDNGDLTHTTNMYVGGSINLSGADPLYLANKCTIWAKNSAGTNQIFLHPIYDDNVTYLNYGSAGWNIRNNAGTNVMFLNNAGNVGIGNSTPYCALDVVGVANIWTGTRFAVSNNYMGAGSLTLGSTNTSYGGQSNFTSSTCGLMLETSNNQEICCHHAGVALHSLLYYQGSSRRIYLGRNIGQGWGENSISCEGTIYAISNISTSTRSTYGQLYIANGYNSGAIIHRNDGSNYYMLISGTAYDSIWNSLRPFRINLSTGQLVSDNTQFFRGGCNIERNTPSGTHGDATLYVTADTGGSLIECRHSNGSQGVGIAYNSIYATGNNADQDLNISARGGNGRLRFSGGVTLNSIARQTATGSVLTINSSNNVEKSQLKAVCFQAFGVNWGAGRFLGTFGKSDQMSSVMMSGYATYYTPSGGNATIMIRLYNTNTDGYYYYSQTMFTNVTGNHVSYPINNFALNNELPAGTYDVMLFMSLGSWQTDTNDNINLTFLITP